MASEADEQSGGERQGVDSSRREHHVGGVWIYKKSWWELNRGAWSWGGRRPGDEILGIGSFFPTSAFCQRAMIPKSAGRLLLNGITAH